MITFLNVIVFRIILHTQSENLFVYRNLNTLRKYSKVFTNFSVVMQVGSYFHSFDYRPTSFSENFDQN